MPSSLRIAVMRCDIGDPAAPNPPLSAYRDVFGPDGPETVLGGWSRATFGYLRLGTSIVVPDVLRMTASELVDEGSLSRDDDGQRRYSMDRRKVGDRAVALAEEAGRDLDDVDGVVVIANQGELRYKRRQVRPYRGGASSLSDGRPMCNLAVDASLYLMAHEVGHVLGYPESFGVRSRAWGWNDPPFDLTPQYGDPFCVMSASVRHGGGTFDYLSANPLSSEWPSATFASAGPGPSLALVYRVHRAALTEDDCVRRLRYDEWHGPHPFIRLYPTTDPTPGRTKLIVLDGTGRLYGADPEQTVYVEYRRPEGLDQGLTPDPTGTFLACSAVVVHELADTRLCVPRTPENSDLPVCVADDGTVGRRGRVEDRGLELHFRARIPVSLPLSRDWRSRSGALIRVMDVATDGSWVEIDVRPGGTSDRSVSFARPVRQEISRTVAFTGHDTLPALCGGTRGTLPASRPVRPTDRPLDLRTDRPVLTRRYRSTVDVVDEEVTLRVALMGFGNDPPNGPTGADPQLTWSIGGTTVTAPAMGQAPVQTPVVLTLPVHRYDLRTGEPLPSEQAAVTIRCRVSADGGIVLTSFGENGNVTVPVTVTATPGAGGGESRSQSFPVLFQGHQRTRDPGLARALRTCLGRILDPSRLAQFESPPWLRGPRLRKEVDDFRARYPDRYLEAEPALLDLTEQVHAQLVRTGDLERARELEDVANRILGIRLAKR